MTTTQTTDSQLADTPTNRKAYNRGWKSGQNGSETAVERADDRREPWAWYAGFYDADNGVTKYASFGIDG
jgi:hypothetical protein